MEAQGTLVNDVLPIFFGLVELSFFSKRTLALLMFYPSEKLF